jgi:diguanylate cyclase (GGDEF)-like protein/PAS domain S-box-containing protein
MMLIGSSALIGPSLAFLLVGALLATGLVVFLRLESRRYERRREAEASLASRLLESFPGVVMLVDEHGVVEQVGPGFEERAGHPRGALLGRRVTSLEPNPLQGELRHVLTAIAARREPWQGVITCRRADGESRYQDTLVLPQPLDDDGQGRLLIVQRDVTPRHRRYLDDQRRLEQLESIVTRLPAVVFRSRQDSRGRIEFLFFSEELQRLCGLTHEAVKEEATLLLDRVHPDDRQRLDASLAQSAVSLEPWYLEFRLCWSGRVTWLEGRALPRRRLEGDTHWDGILVDIDERKQTEEGVQRLVGTDMLTGALNRRALFEQAEAVLAQASRHGSRLSVAMLDLDKFKQLNDTHGHAAGDLVLQRFAMICRNCLRPYDLFARIGGEEFVVVLVDTEPAEAWRVLERLREAVEASELDIGGVRIRMTVSMGLAILEPDGSLEGALYRADQALYGAKEGGRNRIHTSEGEEELSDNRMASGTGEKG